MTDSPRLTLLNARTTAEILEAVARREWWQTHREDEDKRDACPAAKIPSEAALAEWLWAEMHSGRQQETINRAEIYLSETYDGAFVGWRPRMLRAGTWGPVSSPRLMAYIAEPDHSEPEVIFRAGAEEIAVLSPASEATQRLIHEQSWQKTGQAVSIPMVHERWCAIAKEMRPPHPLALIITAWQTELRTSYRRRVEYVETNGLRMSKVPALANAAYQAPLSEAEVITVEVEGEPFVSPGPVQLRRYRAQRTQGQLDAFPATIDGRTTGGLMVEALANLPLTGDERNLLRRDLRGFGEVVCALTSPIEGSAAELIEWLGWPGEPANNLARLSRLLQAARFLQVDLGDGLPRWLFDLNAIDQGYGLDTRYGIAAGQWWQGGMKGGNANAWRLSGGLWRRIQGPGDKKGSLGIGYWGLPDRIIAGIEAALSWGSSSGKGRNGRIPDTLRSVRRGGPGPDRIIPAWHILRLSGEHVTEESYRQNSRHRHRFRTAVQTLKTLGYFCQPSGTATAGGTIEIIRDVKGGNGRQSALVVRASARFCEAYAKGQGGRREWSSAPVSDLPNYR